MQRIALLLMASAVFGAVVRRTITFDESTGTGFVGKGDVQLVFGWNNAMLQANAENLRFTYDSMTTFDVTCEWETGMGMGLQVHQQTRSDSAEISNSVTYTTRKHAQVDGFNLEGFGTITSTGDVSEVGDACPFLGAGTDAVVTAVTIAGSEGGLYVHFGEESYLLENPTTTTATQPAPVTTTTGV